VRTPVSGTIAAVARLPPHLLLLGSISSVQFGSAFATKLFPQAGPAGIVLLRLVLSAAILLSISRPSLRGRTRGDLLAVLAFGVVLGCMNWSFYEALGRLPIGVAVTIEFVGPLAVAVAGSRRLVDLLWVLLAAGGVVLLALRGDEHGITGLGILLVSIAGVCWGFYILLSKRVGQAFASLEGLAIALAVGTVVALPAGIVEGGHALGRPEVLGGGLLVAVFSSLIPYSLELIALRRMSAAVFGLMMSVGPAIAALAGVVVLSQALTGTLLIAVVMVIVATAGHILTNRQPEAELVEVATAPP
jgi:inner membrane transporter RhtA